MKDCKLGPEEQYQLALEDLRKVNDELFYNELRYILQTSSDEMKKNYDEAIEKLKKMDRTVQNLSYSINEKMNDARHEFDERFQYMNEEYFRELQNHDSRVEKKHEEMAESLSNLSRTMQSLSLDISQQMQGELSVIREKFQSIFGTLQDMIDIFHQRMNGEYFDTLYQRDQEQAQALGRKFSDLAHMVSREISRLESALQQANQTREAYYKKQLWNFRLLSLGVGILVLIECWRLVNI